MLDVINLFILDMDKKIQKKPVVDSSKCIGCGMCTVVAPATFAMKNGKSVVVEKPTDTEEKVQEAIESCPVSAIS